MKVSPISDEKFTKQKLLEFLKKGTRYQPFKGYVKEYDNENYSPQPNERDQGNKVEDQTQSQKKIIFKPYQSERNQIGKIIVNVDTQKDRKAEIEREKNMSHYERYKQMIEKNEFDNSLPRIKQFKIDTAAPLTPRSQIIAKNGKLLFEKGLKMKQSIKVETKKKSILASISQLSAASSTQNLSLAHKRSSLESKLQNSLEQFEDNFQIDSQKEQFFTADKNNKPNKYKHQKQYMNQDDTNLYDIEENEQIFKQSNSKLLNTIDTSMTRDENSEQKTNRKQFKLNLNLNSNTKSINEQNFGNLSNRSILTSLKNDLTQSTLNTSKQKENQDIQQSYYNDNTVKQRNNKQIDRECIGGIKEMIPNSESSQQDNQILPQLSSPRKQLIQIPVRTTSNNSNKNRFSQFGNSIQNYSYENFKDNRTFYQTNVPTNNLSQNSKEYDFNDIFYCHDDMVPFESFKKYKYNDPRNKLFNYITYSEKIKNLQERKNEAALEANNTHYIERSVSQYKAPPVGTYTNNYSLIEKKVKSFKIQPEHSLSERNILMRNNLVMDDMDLQNQTIQKPRKYTKHENEEEGFEKMYSDMIKGIQNDVQEQIKKCGGKYLHPDGDLQLQKHLGLDDISKVDQKFKASAKQLRERLNKMKLFLAFYQYQF